MSVRPRNPLIDGLERTLLPQPGTLVIFGGAGDLSARKLLPAVYNLQVDGVLPANFAVVGFARNELDDAAFRALARDGITRFSRRALDEEQWAQFSRRLFYVTGSFDDNQAYNELKGRVEKIEAEWSIPGNPPQPHRDLRRQARRRRLRQPTRPGGDLSHHRREAGRPRSGIGARHQRHVGQDVR